MEELYKDLKKQATNCIDIIAREQLKLTNIREKLCTHPEEHYEIVDYEWRVGSILPDVTICGICGKLIDRYPYTNKNK